MKILVICYCYAPDIGPRAYRWGAIAEHWASQGHHVDVVSGWKIGAKKSENLNGVHVHRVSGGFTENLRMLIERYKKKNTENAHQPKSGESLGAVEFSSSAKALKKIHDLTWKKIYWPDSSCLWFFPALKISKTLLQQENYDAVISSSTPYTGHLVGRRLKALKPSVHWMVDIGDPFAFYDVMPWNNFSLHGVRNYKSEKEVLAHADSVSMTVQSCLEEYEKHFPGTAKKTKIMPPLLTFERDFEREKVSSSERKKIVFTGTFYKGVRDPKYLLSLFKQGIKSGLNADLHIYGRANDCADRFEGVAPLIDKHIFLHGPVDRKTALENTFDADFLINIGNTTTYQVPSKVVDYVGAGKPIINIASVGQDSSLSLFQDYPALLSLRDQSQEPTGKDVSDLTDFVENTPAIPAAFLQSYLEQFRVQKIAQDYMKAISGK